ncbi:hypothetical protein N825_32960 [Skermanella stibiiresistens SB22]|uniref:Uncharacterized protein n=1 Tax=Skermanella stibiiresistens SB22 TaxID=1385369 RepID=W9H3H7_9PROT|nr:hypothetical protein N825_32960 [Skermanella stibiiresistens SB22]
MCEYPGYGRAEMDANTVGRTIWTIVLSRKNALFAGSGGDGRQWTIFPRLL